MSVDVGSQVPGFGIVHADGVLHTAWSAPIVGQEREIGATNRRHCAFVTKINPRFTDVQPEPMHTVNTSTSGFHSYGRLKPIVAGWQNRVFVSSSIVCHPSRA